jgi:hypothetical protein
VPPSLAAMLSPASPGDDAYPALNVMQGVVALCSGARESVDASGEVHVVGNPVDVSLLASFGAVESLALRNKAQIVYERPFNSKDKNHITVTTLSSVDASHVSQPDDKKEKKKKRVKKHAKKAAKTAAAASNDDDDNNDAGENKESKDSLVTLRSFVKGAPEILLKTATHYVDADGKRVEIDAVFTRQFSRAYKQFARAGERLCLRRVFVMCTGRTQAAACWASATSTLKAVWQRSPMLATMRRAPLIPTSCSAPISQRTSVLLVCRSTATRSSAWWRCRTRRVIASSMQCMPVKRRASRCLSSPAITHSPRVRSLNKSAFYLAM